MNDGQMGSVTFDLKGTERRKSDLIQAHFTDSDSQLVVITLTLNQKNELYELEFWKTDFGKLVTYPIPQNLKVIDGH